MSLRIAINGFGRIGRVVVREFARRGFDNIDIVGINDLTDAKTLTHLFKHDSVHGRFYGTVKNEGNNLIINDKTIPISSCREIEDIPWEDVDIVLEATGIFRSKEAMSRHIKSSGAKKVLVSAPAKGEIDATIVLGVNDHILTGKEQYISNASCTTNCLAPMAKVLNDNFGLESGFMLTVHAYTSDQRILDLPHSDLRRARAAGINTIPTTTGAAKAVGLVIPELVGKLQGYACRVPVPDGSLTDFAAVLKKEVTKEEINQAMYQAANSSTMNGILEYSDAPLVSTDIIGSTSSCVFDSPLTEANGTHVKVVGWYDNEYGYSSRICDLLLKLGSQI